MEMALCFLGTPQVLPGLSKVDECVRRLLLYSRPAKTRWTSTAASSPKLINILPCDHESTHEAIIVSIWCLAEILCVCFPVRSRCGGEEARVWHALGGERLHGGVSGTPGRRPCPPAGVGGSARWVLRHSSPEGGASGHGELRESQRHLCTGEDTGKQLAAGGSTQSGGGKQTTRKEFLCWRIFLSFFYQLCQFWVI